MNIFSQFIKKSSLVGRMTATVILITITIGILVAYVVFRMSFTNLATAEKEKILAVMMQDSRELTSLFDFSKKTANTIASQEAIITYLKNIPKEQDENILKLLQGYNIGNEYSSIYLMDTLGETLVATDSTFAGKNYSIREYFKDAIAGKMGVQMAVGLTTKKAGYYFSAPVKNGNNQIIGVIALKRDIDLTSLVTAGDGASQGKNMLVDEYGVVINSNVPERIFKSLGVLSISSRVQIEKEARFTGIEITPLQYDMAQTILMDYRGPTTIDFFDSVDNETEIVGVAKVGEYPFYLVSEADLTEVEAIAQKTAFGLTLISLLSSLCIALAVSFALRRALRAITDVIQSAVRISEGNFKERLTIEGSIEATELSTAFNSMVARLDALYSDMEGEVSRATQELESRALELEKKNAELEKTKFAMMNILQDLKDEREKKT
ncbi:MAG: cache domain-containing protein [Candidatus Paceibacterota bacterium]|jgi:C4-dicarboxylate-specific signal transduction histidine kinase